MGQEAQKSTTQSSVSRLPRLDQLHDHIEEALEEEGHLGLILLSVAEHRPLEEEHGWQKWDNFLGKICETLFTIKHDALRQDDILCRLNDGDFVIIFSPSRKQEWITRHDLELIRQRLYRSLKQTLPPVLGTPYGRDFSCFIGTSLLQTGSHESSRKAVSAALEEAVIDLSLEESKEAAKRSRRLIELLRRRAINIVFEPISFLDNHKILGYGVGSRAAMTDFEEPEKLLRAADEARLLWQLERLCRHRILGNTAWLEDGQILFLKVGAEALFHDPDFKRPMRVLELGECHLRPRQLIFEFSAAALENSFAVLKQAVASLKTGEFGVCVSKVDPSRSSLELISALQPDFVKLDPSLVRNLGSDKAKQSVVASMADFATQRNIKLVAESVEDQADLKILDKLGVDAASGAACGQDDIELDYNDGE